MRGRNAAMQPCRRLALRVEPRLQPLDGHRVKVVVMQVVVARPDDLHRPAAHLLRQERRFDDEVRLGLSAEAAAEQRDVHRHLLERQPEALRNVLARRCGACVGAHTSQWPLTMRAVALGGSIVACARCGR